MQQDPIPEARSGLPRQLERRLVRHYGRTPGGRIKLAAALRALGVLVRRHPKAMLDMLGAGAVQAARVGVQELTARVSRYEKDEAVPEPRRLTRNERRRFRKLLGRAARVDE